MTSMSESSKAAEKQKETTTPKTSEHDGDNIQLRTWFGILAESCQYINEIENAYSMDVSHL